MEASPRPDLRLVDPTTGELVAPGRCLHCEESMAKEAEVTKKYTGALLEIRKLKTDKTAKLWGDPKMPVVRLLHTLHAAATKANSATPTRSKKLDAHEVECVLVCLDKLSFATCLAAIAGITWDPSLGTPRRNGSRETYNTFELAFRNSAKCVSFAERAPEGWTPDPVKVAEVAGVPEPWVRELLGDTA